MSGDNKTLDLVTLLMNYCPPDRKNIRSNNENRLQFIGMISERH